MSLEVRSPPGREAVRGVAAVAMIGVAVAVIALRDAIARSTSRGSALDPQTFAQVLVALGIGIGAVAGWCAGVALFRAIRNLPTFAANDDGIVLRNPIGTIRLRWPDVDRVVATQAGGVPILVIVPTRVSLSRLLIGVRAPDPDTGRTAWGFGLGFDELDAAPAAIAAQISVLRPR